MRARCARDAGEMRARCSSEVPRVLEEEAALVRGRGRGRGRGRAKGRVMGSRGRVGLRKG